MKKIIWIVGTFIYIVFPAAAFSTPLGIEILSESHHISGQTGAGSQYPEGLIDSYDLTSNEPIHDRAEGVSWNTFYYASAAESWAGDFKVETYADVGFSYALAESVYTFQTDFNRLAINVTGIEGSTEHWSTMWYSLTNISTGEQLLYYNYDFLGNDRSRIINEQYNLTVNPENIYEFKLYTYGPGGDGWTRNSLEIDVFSTSSPIPEPTAMLLFCTGLVGLAGSRLRKKKKLY